MGLQDQSSQSVPSRDLVDGVDITSYTDLIQDSSRIDREYFVHCTYQGDNSTFDLNELNVLVFLYI